MQVVMDNLQTARSAMRCCLIGAATFRRPMRPTDSAAPLQPLLKLSPELPHSVVLVSDVLCNSSGLMFVIGLRTTPLRHVAQIKKIHRATIRLQVFVETLK